MATGSTLCVDPPKCKWFLPETRSGNRVNGPICGCYYDCEHLDDIAYPCPLIEKMREDVAAHMIRGGT